MAKISMFFNCDKTCASVVASRKNAIVLDPAVRADIGFDD